MKNTESLNLYPRMVQLQSGESFYFASMLFLVHELLHRFDAIPAMWIFSFKMTRSFELMLFTYLESFWADGTNFAIEYFGH